MRKHKKQIIAMAAFLAAVGVTWSALCFSGSENSTNAGKDIAVENEQYEDNRAITVHFKWEGEDTPHLYYENVNEGGGKTISWPGIPMKKTGEDWYSYTIANAQSADIIFSIGDNYETATLNRTAGEWWFDQDAWYSENPDGENTALADNIKQNESAAEIGKVYNKKNVTSVVDGVATVGLSKIDTVEEYIETYVDTQDLAAAKEASITIHYYSESAVPSIYYWNALPNDLETVWPGQPMTMEKENWYTYSFSDVEKINFLFTYGMKQTEDFTRKTGEWWYKNGKWYSKEPDAHGEDEKPIVLERGDFREETIYFAMTTRFYDGDKSNNVHCWDENAKQKLDDTDPDWRGDFKGLIEKLDYIKALGFSAVWITPVVENASGLDYHGYHAMNFQKVDPRYESDGVTYQTLINEAHKRGMKIIQDVVFNHTGNFGEANLAPMFEKDGTVEGGYGTIECMKMAANTILPDNYNDSSNFKNDKEFGDWQYQTRLALLKDTKDPIHEGVRNDPKTFYHRYDASFAWDFYTVQLGQMAGDCVDLNTENPIVAKYITDSYSKYINMGVDAFRVDTVKHISRLTFNNMITPVLKAVGGDNFYMFGEVCTKSSQVWYRGATPPLSGPFYTWKESKKYDWVYYDESVETAYNEYAAKAPEKVRSDFDTELDYDKWRLASEANLPHGINMASAEQNYNDNANDVDGKEVKPAGTAQSEQPVSKNAFLDGNTYHAPDYSMKSGLDVIDFTMHWNFSTAQKAFNSVTGNYDYSTGKVMDNVSAGGDYAYNDSTWNVTYVDSHDYSPDGNFEYRYDGGTDAWAENLCLLFTFRGIPCIYYGSEVEFQAGKKIDVAQNDVISNSGRAYFGDYLEGEITASDFGVYDAETGSAVEKTLSSPLCKHIISLNKIRRSIPALQKGQYSLADIDRGDGIAFKRRYTDDTTDSFVCVAITNAATFHNIPNGTYQDAVTGETKEVTDGTLEIEAAGKGNMRVYVLNTEKTKAPGKLSGDGIYLK